MDSQDKRMCGGNVDCNQVVDYEDDEFGDILNMLDFNVENLEGDGLTEDWASKLGPLPSEVFPDMLPPVSGVGFGDLLSPNMGTYEPKCHQPIRHKETFNSQLKLQPPPTFLQENKLYRIPRSFEAPSPDSVLERRTSSSASKTVSFGTEIAIPVRTRTKRSQSTSIANSWSKSLLQVPLPKEKKKKRNLPQPPVNENKKCSHCEITSTPQWREGPMGPKTLCNACGVRYRSGRLFPEYRPAASPTFIPSLHSSSHRKVIEMRQKGAGMDYDNYVVKTPHNRLSS